MDGITDAAFREVQKKYGQPDILYTEFVSVEGLCHKAERLLKELVFTESQRPILAQFYGTTPDFFRQAAIIACQLGFDGIDINMGCPAKNVETSGAGAALIKTPELAQQLISATKQGIREWQNGASTTDCPNLTQTIASRVEHQHAQLPVDFQDRSRNIPVSVKTRLGYDSIVISDWLHTLLECQPEAIAIHGRTLKQSYSGQADWEAIGQAAQIIKQTPTKLLGNGDVQSREDAKQKMTEFGVDGVLIGRASFGNPYVFKPVDFQPLVDLPHIALEHAQIFETLFSQQDYYSFLPMRKHLGWYISGQSNAKEIRMQLIRANSSQEVGQILTKFHLI